MMRFCLQSLVDALDGIDVDFVFLSDDCTEDQKNVVRGLLRPRVSSYREEELGGGGNQASFHRQLREAAAGESEFVLLLEDDYFIDSDDLRLGLHALRAGRCDYTTFYYPEDAHLHSGAMRKGTITLAEGLYGTALPSTTLTFLTRRTTLAQDLPYFEEFSNGGNDCALWLRLTGNFTWFLSRLRYPLFRDNPKLFLHIVRTYLAFMLRHPRRRRLLVHVGMGRSAHLEGVGIDRQFNLPRFLIRRAAG